MTQADANGHSTNAAVPFPPVLVSGKAGDGAKQPSPNTLPPHSTGAQLIADFRSDTVTQPSEGMWAAMYEAPLGDDVLGDDETTFALERKVAEMCGKEAALWFPTGTMSNQVAIAVHVHQKKPGVINPEIILSKAAHMFVHECGGIAFHSRATVLPLEGEGESPFFSAKKMEENAHTEFEIHHTQTVGVCVENAMNGMVWPYERLKEVSETARRLGIFVHMDGARLWNAAVFQNRPLSDYGALSDTISLCLSKGLGCPAGSIVVGSEKVIKQCRAFRKLFGGGMRQTGMFAASALYAMEHNWGESMKRTHEDAKWFGSELEKLGFSARCTDTNQVWVKSGTTGCSWNVLATVLGGMGVKMFAWDDETTRVVIHFQTPRENLEKVLQILPQAMKQAREA
uniref:Aromatic amino acid beta-eliminating lyase/threonine aldolase domain-containing protein n=1 Tax=Chromera velia CCMP2878 TaxID=1169474 RepID=A0A0G4GDP0_9ALVE|mmetsp:Transcript_36646/g.72061  ORF Transcript_36646/g.72061 Transcript_36646/m.72061 type:complete len:398 (-) Transcript_36646:166-1359(-)|eukprot:Cvel_21379.t1-p1 / transcript=Cvel_21379.t1 / gene=Cvel_21379 / organism=Chromera_velia_CCMP2878 / gene_product=Low specificity L-threonine aldolase, putative / transcript_product=Low specificity L-threonine aldolase, putative / location=Cvel_scaffold2000:14561-15751(+) / protein_length=397 / sequence_SO=supercontig / SO=protein_coding / is_pseudo=false